MRSLYLNALVAKDSILRVSNLRNITQFKYCTGQNYINSETDDYQLLEVKDIRDKSNLIRAHRNILQNVRPYNASYASFHDTVKYKAKMYGTYGEASGMNPRICWPTREELEGIKKKEALVHPLTLNEMIQKNNEAKAEREASIKAREEEISAKMLKYELIEKDFRLRIKKKEAEAMDKKAKKEKLLKEVRKFFDYKVDEKEDRFQEMLKKIEKGQEKLGKEERKKAQEAKAFRKLTKMNIEASENNNLQSNPDSERKGV